MDIDPQQLAQKLIEANDHGEKQLALALVVLLSVFFARKFGPKLPGKVGAFFGSGWGGMALSFIIGQAGAVVTALEAGTPFSLRLVLSGLVVSLLGSGLHAQVKQVGQSRAKKVAAGLVFLMFFPLVSGCAGAYTAIFESTTKVEKLNGDFAQQFPQINKTKLKAITAAATSLEQGQQEQAAWNQTADRLVTMVEGTHQGALAVRDNVVRIQKGLEDKKNLKKWAAVAAGMLRDLVNLLELAGVRLEVK